MRKELLIIVSIALVSILALSAFVIYGLPYLNTPEHIRQPALEHLHFRAQVVVNDQPIDFSQAKFQQTKPGVCNDEIPESPIHFHDGIDQILHIHWKSITGGEVLKYYGWNFMGGTDDSLGYRFDSGFPKNVPIYGDVLPELPAGANFYVYTGDEMSYKRQDWNDFLHKSIETFFEKQSSFGQTASLNWFEGMFFKKAAAHSGVDHSQSSESHETSQHSQEELSHINNLVGNVVIFVQPNEPSETQIKERFNNLVPLQDSTCGG